MGHNSSKPVKLKTNIRKSSSNLSSNTRNPSSSSEDEADGDINFQQKSQKKKGSKKGKMPLFRKQSTKAKKRQDHQQYLAKESPEPLIDLSHCEIEEVPSGVYALCKVLQKEVLLLHDNWLSSIHSSNNIITDLSAIRVLDVHNNELRHLPDDIGELKCLQVLNLENNRLTKLPKTIGSLSCLQTLNLKGNKIKELPESICQMKSLRMLDIRENRVSELPQHLCQVRTLETLNLDAITMKYPNYATCCSGTEAIMKFLCSECNMEYLPPSNFLLDVLEPPKPELLSPEGSRALQQEENLMSYAPFTGKALNSESGTEKSRARCLTDSSCSDCSCLELLKKHITGYNDMLNQKRLELIEVERQFTEHQEEQAQLALMAQKNRDQMIAMIAQEESKMEEELDKLSKQKEINQKSLIDDLRKVEQGADNLISSLLDMNAKAKKTEELLDLIEEERIKENKLFEVRWEEVQNLRKKEVLKNMEMTLHHSEWFEGVRQNFTSDKENSLQQALENDEMMANAQIESVLLHNDKQMVILLEDLAKQEQLQRDAFEALLLQKDAKHQRITGQIELIQEELSNLTVVELERREFRASEEMNRLAEKRIALIELLSQLMLEQDNRQIELRKRLEEMEQQKEDGQTDYWLVQYQRLMDQKPQSLIDREQNLEISVVKILNKANAEDYIPRFARHRITIETLIQMTEEDFKQMGIHELGIRKDILRCIEAYILEQTKLGEKDNKASYAQSQQATRAPTAPPPEEVFSARQASIVARGLNSECTICLDNTSEVIFMNCGHVCTCIQCCESVQQCPLCRADIVRRVKLMAAQV